MIECNYLVFLDILKRNNVDKHYIRMIKLINSLIKRNFVCESYCLIRLLFEEIMYDLALKIDSSFSLTIKTTPKKIRNYVTINREKLFGDLYDEKYFDNIYESLSKMTHETTIKEFINNISESKSSKTFIRTNQMSMLLTVVHILIISTTFNPELIELSNYLVYASVKLVLNPAIEFNSKISQDDMEKYSNIFSTENDKEYLTEKANERKELFKSLDNAEIKNRQKKVSVRIQVLLKKYSYDELYELM